MCTLVRTLLYKNRERKKSSASRLSSRCNLMNCYCDGPVTPHQNVSKEQIKIKQKCRNSELINKNCTDKQGLVRGDKVQEMLCFSL